MCVLVYMDGCCFMLHYNIVNKTFSLLFSLSLFSIWILKNVLINDLYERILRLSIILSISLFQRLSAIGFVVNV